MKSNWFNLFIIILFNCYFIGHVNCNSIIIRDKKPQSYEKSMHPPSPLTTRSVRVDDESTFWMDQAKKFVTKQTEYVQNKNIAKNIILFVGDGLSIPTLDATRVYMGGEHVPLSFEEFPGIGLSKTYCLNDQVPDSGCTATAYLCGVKGNGHTIGVNGKAKHGDCNAMLNPEMHAPSIAKWAMDAGKVAGLVTTSRVTHASPAGVYSHIVNRDWETDRYITSCDKNVINDIAEQLVYDDGKNLRVILGGGRRQFIDQNNPNIPNGNREDGKNLIEEWLNSKINVDDRKQYINNRTELQNLNVNDIDYLLGLFADDHLLYNLENLQLDESVRQPSLKEMTETAIDMLNKNENGFFLFVEAAKIDMSHHDTKARLALDETAELSIAVAAALQKVNLNETLIIVSADHSHTLSYAGYPNRNADIYGVAGVSDIDQLPYMTLSYTNGAGFKNHYDFMSGRLDVSKNGDKESMNYEFPSMMIDDSEYHGGDDVGVFAIGPWSHLFTGVLEQSYIPRIAAYAACIGDSLKACD